MEGVGSRVGWSFRHGPLFHERVVHTRSFVLFWRCNSQNARGLFAENGHLDALRDALPLGTYRITQGQYGTIAFVTVSEASRLLMLFYAVRAECTPLFHTFRNWSRCLITVKRVSMKTLVNIRTCVDAKHY